MSGELKVYLAAPYAARNEVRAYADDLQAFSHVCTSSWLGETLQIGETTTGAATALSDEDAATHAATDLEGVRRSDWLVMLTPAYLGSAGGTSGGRHVEVGYAVALGIPVLVVGDPENIFHRLSAPQVRVVPTWGQALAFIERTAP